MIGTRLYRGVRAYPALFGTAYVFEDRWQLPSNIDMLVERTKDDDHRSRIRAYTDAKCMWYIDSSVHTFIKPSCAATMQASTAGKLDNARGHFLVRHRNGAIC